ENETLLEFRRVLFRSRKIAAQSGAKVLALWLSHWLTSKTATLSHEFFNGALMKWLSSIPAGPWTSEIQLILVIQNLVPKVRVNRSEERRVGIEGGKK